MAELSPAVERLEETVSQMCFQSSSRRLGHWLLALLDDEDGHPAALLERMQISRVSVLDVANETLESSPLSPSTSTLHRR